MNDLAVLNKETQADSTPPAHDAPAAWMFPTSFAQRRLWFIEQLEPDAALYNFPEAFRIRGRVDPALLERSFAAVIARHEVLRTTFRLVDGEPMQIVREEIEFHLPVIDLRGLEPAAREQELARIIREEALRPFDLGRGPLLRPALVDLDEAEQVLILSLHHIVTDAWSQEILMRELTLAYTALESGQPPQLPKLPIQYADFAAWQRETMQGETLEKAVAFWRSRLAGFAPLELPVRAARSRTDHAPEGETYCFESPSPLAASFRSLARREGLTLFMTLLAGWQAFLARFTGQSDITVGSPISDRSRTETEGLIGFFLNTLVLRTDFSGNPTVSEALRRVRDTTLEAFAHQDLPFEILVENIHPARVSGRNSLLRAMFVLVSGDEKTWDVPGAVFEPMRVQDPKAKFDLLLHLADTGDTIKGALTYDTALFDAATIRRIASQYEILLAGMVTSRERPIGTLPLVTAGEREKILGEWSGAAAPFPSNCTVHSLFAERAALHPDAVAIEEGSDKMTYGELNRQANAIAGVLVRGGIAPGDAVAILLPRSARLIAGILGILKAGAAYVPIDLSYPVERRDLMVRESGAKFLIGEGEVPPLTNTVWLPIDARLTATAEPLPDIGRSSDAAYIMFTSGSTGMPKGVRVLHRGISRLVINTNYIEFKPTDAVAHASNPSFDAATFEIWGALLNGARLVIVPRETLLSPQELAAFIRDRQLSVLLLTTPLFHHFARDIPGAFGTLRYLLVGGDALQPDAARAVLSAARPAHLVNAYGPTEITTIAACHDVADMPPDAATIPIGRPISNTRVHILDGALELLPPGIAGGLYLGGPGVAGGYVNNPDLTAAAFVPDPFDGDPAARLYKTGDRARWREDGLIEFLGRADNQVKIRGFRVEPGEIETALRRHSAVHQAVVLPRADSAGQKQLAAYVVPHPGQSPTAADLRAHLLKLLPEYMVPAAFAFPEALPLNATGKIDLATLQATHPVETSRQVEPPGTWMEASIVEIWEEVLGRHPIGVTDDFFELGGHSLLAIRMLAEIEKRTGIRIPPRQLFEDATIRHLAAAARRPDEISHSPIVAVQAEGSRAPLFFLHGDFVEDGLYCIKLARSIGLDRPFYAIEPHGVHDAAPDSIEEMAAAHLELVRKVQPRGPYVLGGFCNGGLVAFHMAQQLEAAGEKVSSLILISIDAWNAEFAWLQQLVRLVPADAGRKFHTFLKWRRHFLFARAAWSRQLDALARPEPASQLPGRIARKAVRILRKTLGLVLPHPAPAQQDGQPVRPGTAGFDINFVYQQACNAYVPRAYRGRANLLWPAERPSPDSSAGWSTVSSHLKVVQVPGDHFSSLQGANLEFVAKTIRECLDADGA